MQAMGLDYLNTELNELEYWAIFVFLLLQLVFCSVCCEGFHEYCLEEKLCPKRDKLDTWCCKQCLYCHVCFGQNGVRLLVALFSKALHFYLCETNNFVESKWNNKTRVPKPHRNDLHLCVTESVFSTMLTWQRCFEVAFQFSILQKIVVANQNLSKGVFIYG